MTRAPILLSLLLLTACDADDGRAAWRELRAAEGAIARGRNVPAGNVDMGGDLPPQPVGGIAAGRWREWARRAWPAACARLTTIKRDGRIERAGRTCASVDVRGIVPVADVAATGTMIAGEERVPVGWIWTTSEVARACATDPIDTAPRRFRLTRSREGQRWRATPLPVAPPFHDDPVHEACADLPRFLAGKSG